MVLSTRMLSCFLYNSIRRQYGRSSDRIVPDSFVSSKQRYHCWTASLQYVSFIIKIQMYYFSFFIWRTGVFTLIYSVNVSDATDSMVVDRTDLTNKVDHSYSSFSFHFLLCIIVVNGKI